MSVRLATTADIPNLCAWNAAMAWETEHKHLAPDCLRRGVAGVFAEPGRGLYLVAEVDGKPVGCLMLTHEWSDWRGGPFWWIQSVYVVAAARRHGVFRELYRAAEQRAREAGAVGLRLYVETENATAQATYAGLGMQRCHYAMYETEFSAPPTDA